jgi:hypothetical protein
MLAVVVLVMELNQHKVLAVLVEVVEVHFQEMLLSMVELTLAVVAVEVLLLEIILMVQTAVQE